MSHRLCSQKTAKYLLLVTLVYCFCRTLWTSRHIHLDNQQDFYVYDTASVLVRHHANEHIYDGANTGLDPQLKMISPNTVFAGVSRSIGLPAVRMYVYPPILADLLLPLSGMGAYQAGHVWLACNLVMLGIIAVIMFRVLRVRWKSHAAIALYVGLISLFSVSVALKEGQITILLLLLWVTSFYCYQRDRVLFSAFALALASTIKLTPLIAVVPFLIWRNWKWVGSFLICLTGLVGVMAVLNSPAVLVDYVLHVMPAMSRGVPHPENRSLSSCLQMVYGAMHGGTMNQLEAVKALPVPDVLLTLGKVLPLLALLVASVWVFRNARRGTVDQQLEVLAAFAILSVVVSPVSWAHAYVVAYPMLVFMWRAALQARLTKTQAALLLAISLDLGGFLVNDLRQVALHRSEVLAACVTLLGPGSALLGVSLALYVSSTSQAPTGADTSGATALYEA